ncbi:MAG: polymerase sigma-70 factor, subfamily [Clostridia bacterium]|jgi:RNA polymerase sigma-70 factor (ECF subfamily)|nr:polymerase, sigma-24 subunit, subfamily [Clostridiales bacterium]MDK2985170.1 polymerase sigma-70 factor, subfamily [Clostridia bacterium]
MDEKKLLAKVKKGDLESFNILVEKYQKHVYNIAYRFMGSREDASDAAQEAFLKAYRSISKFRNDASFKTWLYHITANVCRDELRKRKNTSVISLDVPIMGDDGQEIDRQLKSGNPSPEEQFEVKENQSFVQEVINSLPEDYRIILILRELQGLSYEEITEALNCSMGTVKSRLSRARKLFKDKIINIREQNDISKRQVR